MPWKGAIHHIIPAKAGIHFSRWNKTLAWVPSFAGDDAAAWISTGSLTPAVTLKVTAQRGLKRGLIWRFPTSQFQLPDLW
jgi:hypothetical protein